MSPFLPKSSLTKEDIKERESIVFLEDILSHSDVKTHFTKNDKNSNIDGKIELLCDRRICGSITVQIKTYPKKYYGKSKFDFPNSIFGYAKSCPIEIVFLIAVNVNENSIYWKHIDKSLIQKNETKNDNKKITIHFEECEILTRANLNQTIKKWKELYSRTCELINQSEIISSENQQLKIQLSDYQNPAFFIEKRFITKIQRFIDTYNYFLDYTFNYIKRQYYSNPWKMAIAVFEYTPDKTSFLIHKIEYGENGLLIRELPFVRVDDFRKYNVLYRYNIENPIDINPEKYALSLIQSAAMEFFEKKNVLFLTTETATEYIFGFINDYGRNLNIKREGFYDLIPLIEKLKHEYPKIVEKLPYIIESGNRRISIGAFYNSIDFLVEQGFTFIYLPYPEKGNYGKRGLIYDFYTPELALEKVRFLYQLMPSLFEAYMITAFPYLRESITFYDGFDLILVNLIYSNDESVSSENNQIIVYYLRQTEGRIRPPEILISLNYQSDIYYKNNIQDFNSMEEFLFSERRLIYKENKFEIMKRVGEDMKSFFGDYYIHDMLIRYVIERFKSYFIIQERNNKS